MKTAFPLLVLLAGAVLGEGLVACEGCGRDTRGTPSGTAPGSPGYVMTGSRLTRATRKTKEGDTEGGAGDAGVGEAGALGAAAR